MTPPYFISNATYNKNWKKEDDLRLFAFLDRLNNKKILWALSNVFESNGKTNADLIEWAAKYNIYYLKHSYRNSNYQKKNKNIDKEVLVTNYVVR
ncbi:MAG: hypothetical protein E7Y34_01485 [Mycoplasma sp.]|nr:hypothetical protein [Mycoplasma sp.]